MPELVIPHADHVGKRGARSEKAAAPVATQRPASSVSAICTLAMRVPSRVTLAVATNAAALAGSR
jgi:hypothetical protein